MEEPVLLLWSDELILLCKWNKIKRNFFFKQTQTMEQNHVEQKPKNYHKSTRFFVLFCFFIFIFPSRPARVKQKKTRMTTTKQKGKKRDKKKKEDSSFFCVIAIYTADWYYDMQISLNHSGRHSARSLTPNRFHLIFDFVAFSEMNSVCCCCCCFDRHRTSKDTVVTRHFLTYNQQREMARKKNILYDLNVYIILCPISNPNILNFILFLKIEN